MLNKKYEKLRFEENTMKKALIAIDTDLGSSIALRYADDIAYQIQMTLYDVHVVDPKQIGPEPGSGWVQKTWENALIESGKEEIKQFLEMEKVKLPLLKNPKILIGDRTEMLLNELRDGQYDLFLEGVPPTVNPLDFYTLLNSRLYRAMPCPVLVVKNLVSFNKVALLLEKETDSQRFISCFLNIFNGDGFEVDLIDMKIAKSQDPIIKEADASNVRLEEIKNVLVHEGVSPNALKMIHGSPDKVADIFREYGLVISSVMHRLRKSNPLIELLGRIASPILICWR